MSERDKLIGRAKAWLKHNDKFDYLREASLSTVMADFAISERKAAVDEFLAALEARCGSIDDFYTASAEVYAEMFGGEEVR